MANLISFICIITLVALINLNPISCHGESNNKQEINVHKLLFVIGDSLFDPGNNQYLNASEKAPQNFWPYGMNFNNHSTGRLSDGRIVPDFIAQFAKLHMLPPYLQPGADLTYGANFASAGSGCLEIHSGVVNLKMQLTNFKRVTKSLEEKLGQKKAKEVLMGSVYMFSIGGNDYFSFNTNYPNATKADRIKYRKMVIGNLTMALKEIYAMGGRKFAFQNVGPLGCLPMIKQMYPQLNGTCQKTFLADARVHNRVLPIILKKLQNWLRGLKYSIFDYYSSLGDRIENAHKYGLKEGKIACCGNGQFNGKNCGGKNAKLGTYQLCKNPSEYVFFDGGHTTERTNQQLAELLWNGTPNITGPLNVKQLFELP